MIENGSLKLCSGVVYSNTRKVVALDDKVKSNQSKQRPVLARASTQREGRETRGRDRGKNEGKCSGECGVEGQGQGGVGVK